MSMSIQTIGQSATFTLRVLADGQYQSVAVESVAIYYDSTLVYTIPTDGGTISYPSEGTAQVDFTIPSTWSTGTYKIVWSFRAGGVLNSMSEYFSVQAANWKFVGENPIIGFDFLFIPLTLSFRKGAREYFRTTIKETYDRDFAVLKAQACLIYYYSQYKIIQSEWQNAENQNGQVWYMLDTANMERGNKWFVQIKIEVDNGETILSPLFNITIE